MTPERLTQLKQIIEHFHGQKPTDAEIAAYCQEQGFDGISAGELEDWTFQFDVDTLRNDVLPDVCNVIAAWQPSSAFSPQGDQQASFRKVERDILALFEARNVPFAVAVSTLESISQIGTLIKNAGMLATDKKVALSNAYLIQRFGADPNEIGVGSYAQECKELAERASDSVVQ